MQNISDDLVRLLSERLKLGEHAKPVCRVEVDRMAFIPGRSMFIKFDAPVGGSMTVDQTVLGDNDQTQLNASAFCFPVENHDTSNITQYFSSSTHKGIDIDAQVGTHVLAAWPGTVKTVSRSETYTNYGYYVDLQHDNGVVTRYGHLSDILVLPGQAVNAGDVIALSGNTGQVVDYRGKVEGYYDDPTSPRSLGWGAHVHFEVRIKDQPVDPLPYMKGTQKMYLTSTAAGTSVQTSDSFTGTPGDQVFWEYFTDREWYLNSAYTVDPELREVAAVRYGLISQANHSELVFDLDPTVVPYKNHAFGFDIHTNLKQAGILTLTFHSDFDNDGELRVKVNGNLAARVVSFEGLETESALRNIGIPSGDTDIRVEVYWKGTRANTFALASIEVQELDSRPDVGNTASVDPTQRKSTAETYTLSDVLFNQKADEVELMVGQFVYMDTLPLDNLISVEIDDQYEALAREARIQISNPKGFYSPDYNPYYFPENFMDTPWSYSANGFQYGVLSENAPVRIYLGYGLSPMRVFTGLIDKVEIVGEDSTLTIHCRDMYKKLINKVISETKEYPKDPLDDKSSKSPWLKSAIVNDLAIYAEMNKWRSCEQDLYYPDIVIEDTYVIAAGQQKGTIIKADPNHDGTFLEVAADSLLTPNGWRNPMVEAYGKTFQAYKYTVADAIQELMKDVPYRSYCDRYGTYRFEQIKMDNPIVAHFHEGDNLVSITKSLDWSRGRSHVVIFDDAGNSKNFVDTEILMYLKGEVRTARLYVPWARNDDLKKQAAQRFFLDTKRLCQTLQVSIPGNPSLDLMDRVYVSNSQTTTREVFTIKGIRSVFTVENGYLQIIDLMWSSNEGAIV